jgi:hypothetical protein
MSHDRDFRICTRLLALAKDRTANEHIRKESRRLAARILRRHKWKASDFSGADAENPMLTTCEIKHESPLTVFQRYAGRLLVDLIPGLESKDMQHKSCAVVKFSIPRPKNAKEVMVEWGVLYSFMQFQFKTFEDHKCGLEAESFCRGVCQGVGESLTEARRMAAKAQERERARELRRRPPEPENPFALICRPQPPLPNIEPPGGLTSASLAAEARLEDQAPQPEIGRDAPDSPAGETLRVDTRSFAQGFDCGRKWNVERILKLI